MTDRPAHRFSPATVVTGVLGAVVALGLLAPPAQAAPSPARQRTAPLVSGLAQPTPAATTPAARSTPTLSCKPWQRPTTVPDGVAFTPRVFPPPTTPAAPSPTSPGRVVCRTVPPTPFAAPAFDPSTVVGGPKLAASGVITDLNGATSAPPAVYDVSYVIADLDSGEILAAKSPHAWLRPASTLKTLTALTLLPRLDPRQKVVAAPDVETANGTRVGIVTGNPYAVSDLVDAMLMLSANDAVYALADAAGGYDRTVALMNAEAKRIGAYDTITVDPSGLDEGDQRSSAYDLALVGRAAMKLPLFRQTVVKRTATFPGGKDAAGKVLPPFEIPNINELLTHYPGAIGVKPGRTDRAQHTFIGAATRAGRTLIVAQMGSVTGAWEPTAALLDWGFANANKVRPVGHLVSPGESGPPALPTATSGGPAAGSSPPTSLNGGSSVDAPIVAAARPGSPDQDGGSHVVVAIVLGTAWLGVLAGVVLVVRRLTTRRKRRPGRHRGVSPPA